MMEFAPIYLFLAVFFVLVLGYPVALSLAVTALIAAGFGIAIGAFDVGFLYAIPSRLFGFSAVGDAFKSHIAIQKLEIF